MELQKRSYGYSAYYPETGLQVELYNVGACSIRSINVEQTLETQLNKAEALRMEVQRKLARIDEIDREMKANLYHNHKTTETRTRRNLVIDFSDTLWGRYSVNILVLDYYKNQIYDAMGPRDSILADDFGPQRKCKDCGSRLEPHFEPGDPTPHWFCPGDIPEYEIMDTIDSYIEDGSYDQETLDFDAFWEKVRLDLIEESECGCYKDPEDVGSDIGSHDYGEDETVTSTIEEDGKDSTKDLILKMGKHLKVKASRSGSLEYLSDIDVLRKAFLIVREIEKQNEEIDRMEIGELFEDTEDYSSYGETPIMRDNSSEQFIHGRLMWLVRKLWGDWTLRRVQNTFLKWEREGIFWKRLGGNVSIGVIGDSIERYRSMIFDGPEDPNSNIRIKKGVKPLLPENGYDNLAVKMKAVGDKYRLILDIAVNKLHYKSLLTYEQCSLMEVKIRSSVKGRDDLNPKYWD